jgi:hypothetical protein
MREIRTSGSEGGGPQTNAASLPLSNLHPPPQTPDLAENSSRFNTRHR